MGAKRYGVPYQGSKNGIAAKIVDALPGGEVFVDLFAGGCAVTHAAMESGKYGRFVVNDADWRGVTLFRDAISGRYRDERRLVDREYFLANKDRDAYVSLCWSFGSNGKDYLWNEVTEGAKLRACRLVMGETWQERRAAYMDFVKYLQDKRAELEKRRALVAEQRNLEWLERLERLGRLEDLESLEKLQSLQSLGRLQRLESLERLGVLGRLSVNVGDYRAVAIPEGAVVYCDPPYKDTKGYFKGGFDHEGFYEWLRTRDCPVWVSEYGMPGDFFPVWGASKSVKYCATKMGKAEERLWLHERWRGRAYIYDLFNQ